MRPIDFNLSGRLYLEARTRDALWLVMLRVDVFWPAGLPARGLHGSLLKSLGER